MFILSPYTLIALTTSYLALSTVLATFFIVMAEGPRYRINALVALIIIACSGGLALQLWSTRILWGHHG